LVKETTNDVKQFKTTP